MLKIHYSGDTVVLQREKKVLSFCEMKEGECLSFRGEIQQRRKLDNLAAVLEYIRVFTDSCKMF